MPISNTVHRLSDFTRDFAARSLDGQYGRALANDYCALVDPEGYDKLTPAGRYNRCLKAIVEQAGPGTDAGAMQLTRGGVIAGTVSIPCRFQQSSPAVLFVRSPPSRRMTGV